MAKKRTLNKGGKKGLVKLKKIVAEAKKTYHKKGNQKKWTSHVAMATRKLKKEGKI